MAGDLPMLALSRLSRVQASACKQRVAEVGRKSGVSLSRASETSGPRVEVRIRHGVRE